MNCLKDLINSLDGGVPAAASVCSVSARAVYKWIQRNRLPRTEYSNETCYAKKIEEASHGKIKASDLLQQTKHETFTQSLPR